MRDHDTRPRVMARSAGLTRDLLLKIELLSDPKALYVVRGAVERLAENAGFAAADCRAVGRAVDAALLLWPPRPTDRTIFPAASAAVKGRAEERARGSAM